MPTKPKTVKKPYMRFNVHDIPSSVYEALRKEANDKTITITALARMILVEHVRSQGKKELWSH